MKKILLVALLVIITAGGTLAVRLNNIPDGHIAVTKIFTNDNCTIYKFSDGHFGSNNGFYADCSSQSKEPTAIRIVPQYNEV
jgi:hypothetical protein